MTTSTALTPPAPLAWGGRVTAAFRAAVRQIARRVGVPPSWLGAVMAFETNRTFDPGIRAAAGSGAVGLIQFMPGTAAHLGTTAETLAGMSALQQLAYVERYFLAQRKRYESLDDLYMAVLWPAAVGKPGDYVLFRAEGDRPVAYRQNAGLDQNKDGTVTKTEAAARVHVLLGEGFEPHNVG